MAKFLSKINKFSELSVKPLGSHQLRFSNPINQNNQNNNQSNNIAGVAPCV